MPWVYASRHAINKPKFIKKLVKKKTTNKENAKQNIQNVQVFQLRDATCRETCKSSKLPKTGKFLETLSFCLSEIS